MKCRLRESVVLARRLLEDGEEDEFDPQELVQAAQSGLNLPPGEPADFEAWRSKIEASRSRTRGKLPLESNTAAFLYTHGDGTPTHIGIRLHNTDIIKIYPDNSFVVDVGPWDSKLSLDRVNRYLPSGWGIYTYLRDWYWTSSGVGTRHNEDPDGRTIQPFTNGDRVDKHGTLHAQAEPQFMRAKRSRRRRPTAPWYPPGADGQQPLIDPNDIA